MSPNPLIMLQLKLGQVPPTSNNSMSMTFFSWRYSCIKMHGRSLPLQAFFCNMIIILATMKMKPFKYTSLFMISLALVDLLSLCTRIPMKEIRLESTVECKVMWCLYNALPMYSNYILVFWTLERVIVVLFPLRASALCTVKRTAIVIAATGIFSFGINVAWPISIVSQGEAVVPLARV